jgi:hypothetical protein
MVTGWAAVVEAATAAGIATIESAATSVNWIRNDTPGKIDKPPAPTVVATRAQTPAATSAVESKGSIETSIEINWKELREESC